MPMFLVLGNFLQDDIQSSWLPPKEVLTKSHIATLLPDKNNLHIGCLIALGTTKGDTDKKKIWQTQLRKRRIECGYFSFDNMEVIMNRNCSIKTKPRSLFFHLCVMCDRVQWVDQATHHLTGWGKCNLMWWGVWWALIQLVQQLWLDAPDCWTLPRSWNEEK